MVLRWCLRVVLSVGAAGECVCAYREMCLFEIAHVRCLTAAVLCGAESRRMAKSRVHRHAFGSRQRTAMLVCTLSAACAAAEPPFAVPDAAFAQIGAADTTYGVTAGVNWNWGQEFHLGPARITGYWEASVSKWSYPTADVRRSAGLVQLGLIPVLRWRPAQGASPWFAEAGIGATLTTVVYQTDRKRFSTRFNFGDHLAVGRSFGGGFGRERAHELSLRLEHFSNAGIQHPNPGENFVQLRYLYKLK